MSGLVHLDQLQKWSVMGGVGIILATNAQLLPAILREEGVPSQIA
jgi:hypothetical protein